MAVRESELSENRPTGFEITQAAQILSFEMPSTIALRGGAVALLASASSGLPVSFEIVSGPASLDGNRLMPLAVGTVWVRAIQAGTDEYLAEMEERSLEVTDSPVIVQDLEPVDASAGATVTVGLRLLGAEPMSYRWFQNGLPLAGVDTASLAFPAFHLTNSGLFHVEASNTFGSITSRVVTLTLDRPGSGLSLHPRGSVVVRSSSIETGPSRMEFLGDHLFLIDRILTGVQIYDISNPDQPRRIATVPFLGKEHEDAAVSGNFLFLAERTRGLGILDVRNPALPVRLPSYVFPGGNADVVTVRLRDGLAYVGNGDHGLSILDMQDPLHPVEIGSLDTEGIAAGVYLQDHLAFVADWWGGLLVADVSVPSRPRKLGQLPAHWFSLDFSRNHYDLMASGPAVLVADPALGLLAFDTRNPNTPQLKQTIPGSSWGLDIAGRFLFSADVGRSTAGLRLFDLVRPLDSVNLGRFSRWGGVYGVQLRGNRLWTAGTRLGAIDLHFSALAPVFTIQPSSLQREAGSSVTLEALATGTEPMTYQWYQGAIALPGETNASITLGPKSEELAGGYSVEVANGFGTARSQTAQVKLIQQIFWREPQTNIVLRLGQPYPLVAEASSGLPVTFRIVSGPAVIQDGKVVVTNAGLVRIRAEQVGKGPLTSAAREILFNRPTVRFTERAVWPGIPPDSVSTMEIKGPRICVGTRQGVAIFDASDPKDPQVEGWIETGGYVNAIKMVGNLAYVVGARGLHIIDYGGPGKPELVGHFYPGSEIQAVDVRGSIAYLGTGYLLIVDVSNPKSPTQISRIEDINKISLIHSHEEWLYSVINGRLSRLDVSNPQDPKLQLAGSAPYATSLALEGGLAYVGTYDGIEVHDQTFARDTPLSRFQCGGVKSLAVTNGVVIASTMANALLVVDFRDHSQPMQLSSIFKAPGDLRVQDDKVFSTTQDGLEVYDLADLSMPRRVQMVNIGQASIVRDLQVVGDLVYLASSAGLRILKISPTNRVVQLGNYNTEGNASAVAVSNNVALLSVGLEGLNLLDVTVAKQPKLIANVPSAAGVFTGDSQIRDSLAFVLNGSSFDVLNIGDPTRPKRVGTVKLAGGSAAGGRSGSLALDLEGHYAVVVLAQGGLAELDLRNPESPVELVGWPEGGPIQTVRLRDSMALTSSFQKGLRIVSLNDSDSARVLGRYDPVGTTSIWTEEDLVFLGARDGSLHVLDLASPYQPVLLGKAAPAGTPMAIQVVGKTVFVADSQMGLRILDFEIGLRQSLGLNLPEEAMVGEVPWELPRSVEPGLSVRYTVVSGPALFEENFLRFTGPGTVVIRAEMPSTAQHLSAVEEWRIQSFVLPEIRLIREGDSMYAEWPTSATDYVLEYSDRLDPAAPWRGYEGSLSSDGEFIRALLPVGELAQFFRLRRP